MLKAIVIKNLFKDFEKNTPFYIRLLEDINLEIYQNEIFGIIGESGTGKSTLVTHFNGLMLPTLGSLEIFGKFLITPKKMKKKVAKELKANVGIVFQFPEYQLFEETVLKDVMFGPLNFGKDHDSAEKIALETLDLVGFPRNRISNSPFELSGGQKRKVALSGILSLDTDLIVFDEPTAGLDPESEEDILQIIETLKKNGKTIVFISHNLDNVLRVCDRVAVFKDKKVSRVGETFDVLSEVKLLRQENLIEPFIIRTLYDLNLLDDLKVKNKKIKNIKQLSDFLIGKNL